MKKGWQTKSLGDLCEIIGGGTPAKDNPAFYSGKIPWATVRDMRNDDLTETEFRITKDAVRNSASNIIPAGNVIIATRVGLGKACILGQDTAINQDLKGVIPLSPKTLDVRFLFWWLKSISDLIIKNGKGATVQGVTLPFIKALQIPSPPLPEQYRIVAVLDEAFENIAIAKANAEQNLKNARELIESHLKTVFTQRDVGWVEKKFEDICVLQRGFDLPTRLRNEGIFPLVSSNGITDRIDLWKVKAPGVVTGRSGTIGKVHYIEEDYWPLNTALYIKEFHGNHEKFIYYFLKQFDLEKYASGAGVPTLNRNDVHCETVWFPNSLAVQKSSVELLDKLSIETQHLESIYQQKITALDELKKTLLHKALAGEL